MKDKILKQINSAVGPQIKNKLEAIKKLKGQLTAMAEQEKTFTLRLETTNQGIEALESEIAGLVSAFGEPDDIERKNAELRRKKEAAEDIQKVLMRVGEAQRDALRRLIEEEKSKCSDFVSGMLSDIHAVHCGEINSMLQAVLDYQAAYMGACNEFCTAADIPIGRFGARGYLRIEGRIGARINSMAGFTTYY